MRDCSGDATKIFIGKVIKKIEYLSDQEVKDMMWYNRAPVIVFTDGTWIMASKDDEGNDVMVAAVRNGKMELLDVKGKSISTWQVPYGSKVFVENKEQKDEIIKVLDNAEVNGELDFAFNVSTTSSISSSSMRG